MLKIILTTFIIVFLAELGDKTQLQVLLLTTQKKSPLGVFLGASLALVLSALFGVLLGSYIDKHIPTSLLQLIAGMSFIIIGILTILV